MTFEEFRIDIESKLQKISKFELLEYHYIPFSFGSGLLVFRIKGHNHKFVFEGRDNELTWFVSKPHNKYLEGEFIEIKKLHDLKLSLNDLNRIIDLNKGNNE